MYFTFIKSQGWQQPTMEEIYANILNQTLPQVSQHGANFFYTFTKLLSPEEINEPQLRARYPFPEMKQKILSLIPRVDALLKDDMSEHYYSFFIPKSSGGLRKIDAPNDDLKCLLTEIKLIFENNLRVLPHNTAYAYVKGRSTKDALLIHQQNESKWFLKLDIKDFFPSCNKTFIMAQLEQLFPFKMLMQDSTTKEAIEKIIKLCLLNNTLPQGTPMSPLLTNLIMIPIDYQIERTLWDFAGHNFKYTRYADDMLISAKHNFRFIEVEREINNIFQQHNAPFKIKTEKTRYGSTAGRNWNLGLMLNKDNNITIGYKKKQRLKATIFTFLQDLTNGTSWDILETQILNGQISYYKKIEPEYVQSLISKYSEKFNRDLETEIKNILRS